MSAISKANQTRSLYGHQPCRSRKRTGGGKGLEGDESPTSSSLARKKGVDGSTTVSTEMGCGARNDGPKAASNSDQDGEPDDEACRTVVVARVGVVGDVRLVQEEQEAKIELGGAKARRRCCLALVVNVLRRDDDEGIGCFAPSTVTANNNPRQRHNKIQDGDDEKEPFTIIVRNPSSDLFLFAKLLLQVVLVVDDLVLGVVSVAPIVLIEVQNKSKQNKQEQN